MLMKLVTSSQAYNIVTAYALNEGCKDKEKQKFYELAEVTDNIEQTEEIVLVVDLNGRVGTKREEYERQLEGKTLGQRNKEGKMILEVVRASNLALVNIFFTKSPEQTYTYKSRQN